jgi:hypothetical protein
MSKVAVFINTMSIQKYIFASNKLKENIGASYIVKKLFDDLENNFVHSYVGGGNALLYFDSIEKAKNAMKEWSLSVLQSVPGVIPVITIDDNFDDDNYNESRENLIQESKKQEHRFIAQTELGSFGITDDCSRTGLSADVWGQKLPDNEQKYISSVSYSKILASEKSNTQIQTNFGDVIGRYKFTDEIDKLGSSKGENSHIAIVHIDGNNLGEKFRKKKTEKEVIEFSCGLKNAVKETFRETLKKLLKKLPELEKENEISLVENNLPIRPIVIGGDDITFICDARLSLYLTKEFVKSFEKQKICKNNYLSACAGISIVKTKYPFYRAYEIAEDLCSNAKRKRKEKESLESYIDFHISFGGLRGSLQEIRDANYKSADGKILYKRPYSIKEVDNLLECVTNLSQLPQTKIKKLRKVLYKGQTATEEFIKELKYRDNKLPILSHPDEAEKGFSNSKSPYMDMIELIDFCPETLLKEEGNNG